MPRKGPSPPDDIGSPDGHERGFAPLEHELTMTLERAHELGRRAERANGAVQDDIERARAIVADLRDQVHGKRRR